MITIVEVPFKKGHLKLGWASWDDGNKKELSLKYTYPDVRGRVSRGSPEISLEDFLHMREFFIKNEGTIDSLLMRNSASSGARDVETLTRSELVNERDELRRTLLELQRIQLRQPWVDIKTAYDQVGERQSQIKSRLGEPDG